MTEVRITNDAMLLESEYLELAKLLASNTSFQIRSKSIENTKYFINNFFNQYNLRSRFLRQNKDKYIFIELNENSYDSDTLDQQILVKTSELIGIEFTNLTSLLGFLESQDNILVVLSNSDEDNLLRLLLSYNFILKNHFLLIIASSNYLKYIDQYINLTFSEAFMNFYIGNLLQKIGTNIDELNLSIDEFEGDLSKVPSLINQKLLEKKSEELFLKSNTFSEPETIKVESSVGQDDEIDAKSVLEEQFDMIIPDSEKIPSIEETLELGKRSSIENEVIYKSESSNTVDSSEEALSIKESDGSLGRIGLTSREKAIYNALVKKTFISRSDLAQIVWGEEGKNAKDDAIDQVVSRLRRKFVKAGFDKNYIFSKKGEGIGINL